MSRDSIGRCTYCDEEIQLGDEYAEIEPEGLFHKFCLNEMDRMEILQICGINFRTVEVGDVSDPRSGF